MVQSDTDGADEPMARAVSLVDGLDCYSLSRYQTNSGGRCGWFPVQCVKKVDLLSPAIPKNLKVKAHLLRNVNLQKALEVSCALDSVSALLLLLRFASVNAACLRCLSISCRSYQFSK